MEQINRYFGQLTEKQQQQFASLGALYQSWNEKINVISRKDMEHFYEHHVLHSLGIAKVIAFKPGTKILDIGTGGGFPGIPLAILFPEAEFTLVDSIGKKIKVVKEIASFIGLQNVAAIQLRAEEVDGKFDFVVSRAVTALPEFLGWVSGKFSTQSFNTLPNGVLYLKGGDLQHELRAIKKLVTTYELSSYFDESFFETKKLVHIKM